jgi:hypothetical protein
LDLRSLLWRSIRALIRSIQVFWRAAEGSLKDHLNVQELTRIAVTALAAGGGVFGLLDTIVHEAGVVFPSPGDAAVAAVVLTVILEGRRRLSHGEPQFPSHRRSPHYH